MAESEEAVALELLTIVAKCEGRTLDPTRDTRGETPDRKWILDTYAESLKAVLDERDLDR